MGFWGFNHDINVLNVYYDVIVCYRYFCQLDWYPE